MYCRTLLNIADGFFVLIITCVTLSLNSLYMLILPAVITPFLLFARIRYTRAARKVSTDIRACNAALNLTVQQNIDAVRLVRSFANEEYEENKFDAVNNELREAYCRQASVSAKYGMIFNIISMAINASQRGAGNTKIAMRTNVTSNVVNMIGNYLLIQGHLGFPAMGIAGAALATVFGTIVACIMSICSLIPKDNFVSIPYIIKERVRITLEPAKNMAKIASSVFIEQVFMRTGFLLVSIMAARLGTSAYAAHQVAMNVMNLSFSFGDGMQVASVALCGRSLGEKRPDLAVMYGTICQRIGNMISIVLSILYLTLGNWYFHLYFVEEDIIAMGARIMQVRTVIVLLQISQVIYMGCLRGAGDVVFTTCASTLSITIVRPSCAYLFCYVLEIGVVGIWLGIVCDQIVRVCLTNWRFKSGKWTKIKI